MSETVERTSLDLRYQTYRMRNDAAEARLLASIAERGIEQASRRADSGELAHPAVCADGRERYRTQKPWASPG
jgi:hypothetical protein